MRAQPKMSHGLTPVETCIAVLGNVQMGFLFWHLIFSAGWAGFCRSIHWIAVKTQKKCLSFGPYPASLTLARSN